MFFTGKWSILRCVLVLSYFSATHLTSCAFISIPTMIALGIIFIMICLCQCVIKFEVMIRILNCQTYSFWLMSCLLSVACILAVLFVTVVGVDSVIIIIPTLLQRIQLAVTIVIQLHLLLLFTFMY